MQPVGCRITRILTDYAQKLPGHWCTLCDHPERFVHLNVIEPVRGVVVISISRAFHITVTMLEIKRILQKNNIHVGEKHTITHD